MAWLPALNMPQNKAGKTDSHTMIMMRLRSTLSRTCGLVRVTVPGVYIKVAKAS